MQLASPSPNLFFFSCARPQNVRRVGTRSAGHPRPAPSAPLPPATLSPYPLLLPHSSFMLCQTPRMSAWSPPESLSGTPTSSSAGSLPRTPTDDAPPPPSVASVAPPASSRPASKALLCVEEQPGRSQALLSFGLMSASSSASSSAQDGSTRPSVGALPKRRDSGGPNTPDATTPSLCLAAPFEQDKSSSSSSATQLTGSLPSVTQATSATGAAKTRVVPSRVVASAGPSSLAPPAQSTGVLQPQFTTEALPAGPGTPPSKYIALLSAKPSTSRPLKKAPVAPLPPPAAAPRKRRKRSTPEQIEVLERHFAANDRPTAAVREAIASELSMCVPLCLSSDAKVPRARS